MLTTGFAALVLRRSLRDWLVDVLQAVKTQIKKGKAKVSVWRLFNIRMPPSPSSVAFTGYTD
jgi:hypothetical protein